MAKPQKVKNPKPNNSLGSETLMVLWNQEIETSGICCTQPEFQGPTPPPPCHKWIKSTSEHQGAQQSEFSMLPLHRGEAQGTLMGQGFDDTHHRSR